MNTPIITSASVKVMRSFDYCHFEVSLSTIDAMVSGISGPSPLTPDHVDELRKIAARLSDKAVEQYKIAKTEFEKKERDGFDFSGLSRAHEEALAKPESDRTPRDKAAIKKWSDHAHYSRQRYDYEDDWNDPDDFDYSIDEDEQVEF